jgi:hypothetical protein
VIVFTHRTHIDAARSNDQIGRAAGILDRFEQRMLQTCTVEEDDIGISHPDDITRREDEAVRVNTGGDQRLDVCRLPSNILDDIREDAEAGHNPQWYRLLSMQEIRRQGQDEKGGENKTDSVWNST